MKTETEFIDNILKITITICKEFSELMKNLNEMQIPIPDVTTPEINIKILQDYYNSLQDSLRKYAPNHSNFINNF